MLPNRGNKIKQKTLQQVVKPPILTRNGRKLNIEINQQEEIDNLI